MKRMEEILYKNIEDIRTDFKDEKLLPSDLQPSLAKAINSLLDPIRDHFKNNSEAYKLMIQVKEFKVTK